MLQTWSLLPDSIAGVTRKSPVNPTWVKRDVDTEEDFGLHET
ncbi:MAG: hypothetical protein QOJ40_363 [Verrucomicrobiota bacterium]